jgi:hypothetical protein
MIMNTLIVRNLRILRFGLVSGVSLAAVALVALGVTIAFTAIQPSARSANATPATVLREPVNVSVTGVRILPIDPSHLPASQYEFVAIGVQFANGGSTPAPYGVNSFRVRDQAGVTFSPDTGAAYLIGASALPLQGTLRSGERRAGSLVFQLPMSDHTAALLWLPDAATESAIAMWTLAI